jgi:hypothetical protein
MQTRVTKSSNNSEVSGSENSINEELTYVFAGALNMASVSHVDLVAKLTLKMF